MKRWRFLLLYLLPGLALLTSPPLQTAAFTVLTVLYLLAVGLTCAMLLIALLRGTRR